MPFLLLLFVCLNLHPLLRISLQGARELREPVLLFSICSNVCLYSYCFALWSNEEGTPTLHCHCCWYHRNVEDEKLRSSFSWKAYYLYNVKFEKSSDLARSVYFCCTGINFQCSVCFHIQTKKQLSLVILCFLLDIRWINRRCLIATKAYLPCSKVVFYYVLFLVSVKEKKKLQILIIKHQ